MCRGAALTGGLVNPPCGGIGRGAAVAVDSGGTQTESLVMSANGLSGSSENGSTKASAAAALPSCCRPWRRSAWLCAFTRNAGGSLTGCAGRDAFEAVGLGASGGHRAGCEFHPTEAEGIGGALRAMTCAYVSGMEEEDDACGPSCGGPVVNIDTTVGGTATSLAKQP